MSPYPSEHSCRIKQPGEFQPNSFRRIKNKDLSIIIGKLKGQSSTTTQAYRYPTDQWTEGRAKKHCQDAGGTFEAAAKQTQQMEVPDADFLDPKENPMIKVEED